MEYRDIYDKNKQMTGKTFEKSEGIPEGYLYLIVVCFMQNNKGKFLMQKRATKKDGKWAATGGHPKAGENSLTGMITEIKEELGIEALPQELQLLYSTRDDNNRCFYDLYYLKKDYKTEKMLLQREEVEQVYWFSKEKVKELCDNGEFKEIHIEAYEILMKKAMENIDKFKI